MSTDLASDLSVIRPLICLLIYHWPVSRYVHWPLYSLASDRSSDQSSDLESDLCSELVIWPVLWSPIWFVFLDWPHVCYDLSTDLSLTPGDLYVFDLSYDLTTDLHFIRPQAVHRSVLWPLFWFVLRHFLWPALNISASDLLKNFLLIFFSLSSPLYFYMFCLQPVLVVHWPIFWSVYQSPSLISHLWSIDTVQCLLTKRSWKE
jgi:hypothetical protein